MNDKSSPQNDDDRDLKSSGKNSAPETRNKSALEKLFSIYTEDLSESPYVEEPEGSINILGLDSTLAVRIIFLGFPVIFGMLTQTFINIIDSSMVGRLPEKEAVAGTGALGISLLLLWFFGGFLSSISVGTQALTSRRYGEGETALAGKVLSNSLVIAVTSSIVVTIIALFCVEPYYELVSSDPDIQSAGISYSQYRVIGILGMVCMASYKSFYDGVGLVLVHMFIAVVMNLVNALLNYMLIFGKWGAPQLGTDGAAIASVVASFLGLLLMILWSLRKRDREKYRVYRLRNLDLKISKKLISLSVSAGLATMFVMSGFGLFYTIVGRIDDPNIPTAANTSATATIISIMSLVFMTCLAFGTSTSTLVSQSLGAKKPQLAARYGWQSAYLMMILMAILGTLIAFFPEEVMRLFLPRDVASDAGLKDAVIAVAIPSLRVCGFMAPVAAAALVLTQALYGAGKTLFVMVVELCLHFGCLVPLAYLLAIKADLGLIGCWYAAAIYGAALAIIMGIKFASGGWKKSNI